MVPETLDGIDAGSIDIQKLLSLTVAAMAAVPRPSTFGVTLSDQEREALDWLRQGAEYDPSKRGKQPWGSYLKSYEKYKEAGPEFVAHEPKRQEKAGFIGIGCDPKADTTYKLLAAKELLFCQTVTARLKITGKAKIGELMVLAKGIGYRPKTQTSMIDSVRKATPFYSFRFSADGCLELKPGEEIPPFAGWRTFADLYVALSGIKPPAAPAK